MKNKVVVSVKNLSKAYGDFIAVDNISFDVYEGEIFGMVGPNGAGKTTAIECIEGMRHPNAGIIRVLNLDPKHNSYELKQRIGIQLQESSLPDRLRVREVMDLFSSFYNKSKDWRSLLEKLGLLEKLNSYFTNLSGGQKNRLFIALSLINNPDLLFLDELTTGLDPQSRRAMWDLLIDIKNLGKTIFLTTHYMEEAERLCDRVLIIDHGCIVALNTPENLIKSLGAEKSIAFTVEGSFNKEHLRNVTNITRIEQIGERIFIHYKGEKLVSKIINILEESNIQFKDFHTQQTTLDDVFLSLTGREMRD